MNVNPFTKKAATAVSPKSAKDASPVNEIGDVSAVAQMFEDFHRVHDETFGFHYEGEQDVELVNLRVQAVPAAGQAQVLRRAVAHAQPAADARAQEVVLGQRAGRAQRLRRPADGRARQQRTAAGQQCGRAGARRLLQPLASGAHRALPRAAPQARTTLTAHFL